MSKSNVLWIWFKRRTYGLTKIAQILYPTKTLKENNIDICELIGAFRDLESYMD